jgi:hypothetical protein
MLAKFWALTLGALLLLSAPALGTVVITEDGGGTIVRFEERYAMFKAADQLVIIDGDCISACTLVFTIMPRDRVCVTERARFGFHNAYVSSKGVYLYSPAGTDMVYKAYPSALKRLLADKGWTGGELPGWREGALVWVDYREAVEHLGIRICTAEDFEPETYRPAAPSFVARIMAWLGL